MVVNRLQDRSEAHTQVGQVLKGEGVPVDLDFLAFRVGHNLPGQIDLVGVVEHVQTQSVDQVSVVDLLEGSEAQLDDVLDFLPGDLHKGRLTPGTRLMTSSTSIWQ